MWSPYRQLRAEFPSWQIRYGILPDDVDGLTDPAHLTIWIDQRLGLPARRSVLAHELEHVRRGHDQPCAPWVEDVVEDAAARKLIAVRALVDAVSWTFNLHEAADCLNVDTGTLTARLRHLRPTERTLVIDRLELRRDTA